MIKRFFGYCEVHSGRKQCRKRSGIKTTNKLFKGAARIPLKKTPLFEAKKKNKYKEQNKFNHTLHYNGTN